jgi:hypothetical protein
MPIDYTSELAKKLNLKPGTKTRVLGRPEDVDLAELDLTDAADAGSILLFARTAAEVEAGAAPVVEAARADRLAWIAYPKAGQLGTDLNRDLLWKQMMGRGIRPVRQIAIDDVWSALRFRPER